MDQPAFSALRKWLNAGGGLLHEGVCFQPLGAGNTVIAAEDIPADTTIVSCPFSLVITEELAKRNLSKFISTNEIVGWTERQWISTYICFHWILSNSRPPELEHYPYLDTLPPSDSLRTPLHFTEKELEAFKGSNVYQATIDRRREWNEEWRRCQSVVIHRNRDWGSALTWFVHFHLSYGHSLLHRKRYLTAATYISSRAFPSSLLSPSPTLKTTVETQPVLLPGVDSLNHKRAQPVSWSVMFPAGSEEAASKASTFQQPTISLILHTKTTSGNELFNNYGPKPNAELVLGYGFSLPDNPDDTILLKMGGIDKRWEIGRQERGADAFWDELLQIMKEDRSEDEQEAYEVQLDAADMLASMVQILLNKLPSESKAKGILRPEVTRMWHDYIQGQTAILSSLLDFCKKKEVEAVKLARSLGVELVIED
ncbi:Ribosomal N-lysine methyltransferase set10 [Leucoagaricus sp. SymC.cos]|nr:Ribosomal N-lysine methyltransferase set10 [Leucoagaricus sp. SymC.cos]